MSARVILIGGASRAARAIAGRIGDGACVPVVRGPGGAADGAAVTVADYREVPAEMDLDGAVLVNCVGSPLGSEPELLALNRDVPVAWAQAGRERGARGFIQLSSFSIYAPGNPVDAASPLAPATAYGRSKLAAERELATLAKDGFAVDQIRVPILVGAGSDKLAQLVRFVKRTGIVPMPGKPVPRPMLSYSGLAAVVAGSIARPTTRIAVATDPEPFDYPLLRQAALAAGHRAIPVPVPGFVQAAIRLGAPGVHRSMFEPMPVSPEINLAETAPPFERLRDVLERLFTGRGAVRALS